MAATRIRTAAVVATGEELVRGSVVDTNSSWIATQLRRCGVALAEARIVGDGLDSIRDAVLDLCTRVDLVIVTGGLGPTPDDRTRDGLAAAAAVPLEQSTVAHDQIAAYFAQLGKSPSESNGRQAMLPQGSRPIRNPLGSAPGIELSIGRARVVAIPGVPSEMRAMVEQTLLPLVRGAADAAPFVERWLQVVGLPESVLGERIKKWMESREPPIVSDTVHHGIISVCASDRDDETGRIRLAACVAEMRSVLGEHVFAEGGETLAEVVVAKLRARGETVALAESCTGGLLAAALTDIGGSSEVLIESCVTYANSAKERTLGISAELLRRHGAVSEQIARAMAQNVRARSGATHGVATTGIAGPTGGTKEKPVGMVHLAVVGPRGADQVLRRYPGDRDSVRRFAVIGALDLLRRQLQ